MEVELLVDDLVVRLVVNWCDWVLPEHHRVGGVCPFGPDGVAVGSTPGQTRDGIRVHCSSAGWGRVGWRRAGADMAHTCLPTADIAQTCAEALDGDDGHFDLRAQAAG